MKADAKTEAEVMSVMKKLIDGYKKRDIEGIISYFAPDPDLVCIGTGVDEKRIGLTHRRAQLERDFAQVKRISVDIDWYSVSSAGSVARPVLEKVSSSLSIRSKTTPAWRLPRPSTIRRAVG